MFQEHIGIHSYNFDLQQYIYKKNFGFSRDIDQLNDEILIHRLRLKSKQLSLNSYNIDKNILSLKNANLKSELLRSLSSNMCDNIGTSEDKNASSVIKHH